LTSQPDQFSVVAGEGKISAAIWASSCSRFATDLPKGLLAGLHMPGNKFYRCEKTQSEVGRFGNCRTSLPNSRMTLIQNGATASSAKDQNLFHRSHKSTQRKPNGATESARRRTMPSFSSVASIEPLTVSNLLGRRTGFPDEITSIAVDASVEKLTVQPWRHQVYMRKYGLLGKTNRQPLHGQSLLGA